jgi:hypothetical protein
MHTILPGFSLYSNLGQAPGLLFFSTGCGKESGLGLGLVMRYGTADLSGAFLSPAFGGSAANAFKAHSMVTIKTIFMSTLGSLISIID